MYRRLAQAVLQWRASVALVATLLGLLCLVTAFPPKVNPNLLELLPRGEPAAEALRRLHHEEGGTNLVTLAFEGSDPEELEGVLEGLAADLARRPDVRWALHEVDPELAKQIGLLQLDPASVRELTHRLTGAAALGPAVNPILLGRLMELGPFTEEIERVTSGQAVSLAPGQGRLLVRPTGSSHDPVFAVQLVDGLEAVVKARLAGTGVRQVWMGGSYRHNVEDLRGIQSDMGWTTGVSLALVLLVVTLAFRTPKAVLVVFLPLLWSTVVTLALTQLLLGELNTYTAFSSAILLGLGIDFAVHLVGRVQELRAKGQSTEEAVLVAWERVGPPCFTAAATSAAGFLSLVTASFQGFQQLGLVLAGGLCLSFLAMLTLVPPLLVWVNPPPTPIAGAGLAASGSSRSSYRVAPWALAALVLLTGWLAFDRLPRLEWEYDFSALRRDGLAYDELSETERALARESYSPVVVSFPEEAQLRQARATVQEAIEGGRLPHVARAMAWTDLLPTDQEARVEALRGLVAVVNEKDLRALPPTLTARLAPLRGHAVQLLTREDLPLAVRDLLGAREGGQHRLLVFPKGNMWDLREAASLGDELGQVLPGLPLAGEYVALGSLYRLVGTDLPRVAGLALFLVAVLTALDLRQISRAFIAVTTLVAAVIWAFSAVQLFGVKLSILNVVGLPILFGLGVDLVIHLLHRFEEEGPGGLRRALATTGVAAVLSTLTTVLSFASLMLAGNRGIRSFGVLVTLGLTVLTLLAVSLLASAWATRWRLSGQAPGDAAPAEG